MAARTDSGFVLDLGLREHLPGLHVLERDLAFARQTAEGPVELDVDLVGVERDGRVVLALAVDGGDDESLLAALDLVAWSEESRAAFAQHWRAHGATSLREPLVVIVGDSFAPRVLAVLRALRPERVRLLERVEVRGAHARVASLVPRDGHALSLASFAEKIPIVSRVPFAEVEAALARLDERTSASAHGDTVVWRRDAEDVCALRLAGERWFAAVGADREELELRSAEDVDRVLDRVVRAHLAALDAGHAPRPIAPREPILTPEEMAAFRD